MARACSRPVSRLLAGACLAAGFLLAGCGDNLSTSEARQAAKDAAARTASAGQPRATDKLMDLVAGNSNDDTVKSDLAAHPADYIKQNAAKDDLTQAVSEIQKAAHSDVGDSAKAAYNYELGTTQLALSNTLLDTLEGNLSDITSRCSALEGLAQASLDLSSQADALENFAKSNTSSRAAVTKADEAAAAAKSAVADKQKQLSDLKAQIVAKQDQARQIYAATDTAFQAAGQLKGQTAIDAGNKAMEDRRQADQLMQDVGNLAPQVAQTQAELDLLNVTADSAATSAKAAADAFDQAGKREQDANERIKSLREAAGKLVTGDNGVTAGLKQVRDLTADLDASIQAAAKPADDAAQAFAAASAAYTTFARDLNDKVNAQDLKSGDPLFQIAKETRMQALLAWSRAAALQQSGRVSLAGYQASEAIDRAVRQASLAGEKLGVKAEGPVALNGTALKAAATGKFTEAVTAADNGINMQGKETDLIKWLGNTVKAVAEQGLYLTTNDPNALTAAKKARDAVGAGNPAAANELSWIGQ